MKETALLIVDVQKGFDEACWGKRNNPGAEANIGVLLNEWRKEKRPVIHVRHCSIALNSPFRPELPGFEFKEEAQPLPGEKQFSKTVNSAFIGTPLENYLRECGIVSIVIVGFTTDHCISTTVRMGGNLGFEITLVSDAAAAFDRKGLNGVLHLADDIHHIHLASLNGEFCVVRSTEEVLNESRALVS